MRRKKGGRRGQLITNHWSANLQKKQVGTSMIAIGRASSS